MQLQAACDRRECCQMRRMRACSEHEHGLRPSGRRVDSVMDDGLRHGGEFVFEGKVFVAVLLCDSGRPS